MKFFERCLPAPLQANPLVYNFSVVAIGAALFFCLLPVLVFLAIVLSYLIDTCLKNRGYRLEAALMPLILLLCLAAAAADLFLCVALILTNLKW